MDALLMCGGEGSRLGGETEKPLVPVCGVPMVDRVAAALRASHVDAVHAVVSPDAPATARHVRDRGLSVVETAGEGYVSDLTAALDAVGRPVVTVAADLPHLASEHVDDAIDAAREAGESAAIGSAESGDTGSAESVGTGAAASDAAVASVSVCVPADLKRRLGASVDTAFEHRGVDVAPTGLNVVGGEADTVQLTYDDRIAVNVNRPRDLELAEALCD